MIWLSILAGVILVFGFVVFWGAPYVPSKSREAHHALTKLRPLTSDDLLVDIGSGDGIILRIAAAQGARAVGYELNPVLVLISKFLCRQYPGVQTRTANFYLVTLPADTTVVYTFGDSRDITKMAKYVQTQATKLGHSIDFVSFAFTVPGLKPVKQSPTHHLYRFDPLQ